MEVAFRYEGFELDVGAARLVCRYSLGTHHFTEEVRFEAPGGVTAPSGGKRGAPAAEAAARLVHLFAGVSYYKTFAPPVVDLGALETTAAEREFLRTFYVEGLAELAHRNGLDLSGLHVVGRPLERRVAVVRPTNGGRPLVPFGAGIDSIVTAEHVRAVRPDAALFVVNHAGDRFPAIERALEVAGMPVVRAERRIDPAVARPASPGFLNGHVPVTGILSSIAVLAAVLFGFDDVVMANERSASAPTLVEGGRAVNHQWSKGEAFESGLRSVLASTFTPAPEYFSFLRDRSELWVAAQFSELERYHRAFISCNRAFLLDSARRADHWCGECDKCCFIDLVLAPFVPAAGLHEIFAGHEPLENPALDARFSALLGTGPDHKPFECVGDEEECRVAALLAARRPDRSGSPVLGRLAAAAAAAGAVGPRRRDLNGGGGEGAAGLEAAAARLLRPEGPHFVPPAYHEADGGGPGGGEPGDGLRAPVGGAR